MIGVSARSAIKLPKAGIAEHITAQSLLQSLEGELWSSCWGWPVMSAQWEGGSTPWVCIEAIASARGMAMAAWLPIMLTGAKRSASMVRMRTMQRATIGRRYASHD